MNGVKEKRKERACKLLLSAVLLSVLFAAVFFGSKAVLKSLYPIKYNQFVEVYAMENELSPYFVFAVIECESGFDPDAVSYTGATGLMQIMPDTFDWINKRLKEDLPYSMASDPETSIKYGCHFYGYLMKKYKNEATALAAYHAGMTNADKWLKDENYSRDGKTLYDIPFPTTKKYVERVLKTKKIYVTLYDRKDD